MGLIPGFAKGWKQDTVAVAFILSISLLTIHFMFDEGCIIYFWDAWLPFDARILIEKYSSAWLEENLGGLNSSTNVILTSAIYWFMGLLGLPLYMCQKTIYFTTLAASGVASYFAFMRFSEDIFKRSLTRVPVMAGALLYMYNPYAMIYTWLYYPQTCFSLPALPLAVYCMLSLRNELSHTSVDLRRVIIWDLAFSINMLLVFMSGIKNLIGVSILILVIILVAFLSLPAARTRSVLLLTPVLCSLLLTAYFWLPVLLSLIVPHASYTLPKGTSYVFPLKIRTAMATPLNTMQIVGMSNLSLEGVRPTLSYFYESPFVRALLSVPMAVSLAPIFQRRSVKALLVFSLLLITYVGCISVTHLPLVQDFYVALYTAVPLLVVLNDPWAVFGLAYVFLLSILFSHGAEVISIVVGEGVALCRKRQTMCYTRILACLRMLALLAFLVTPLVTSLPLVTGRFVPRFNPVRSVAGISNLSAEVKLPPYEMNAAEYLNSLADGKVLVLPSTETLTNVTHQTYSYAARQILSLSASKQFVGTSSTIAATLGDKTNPLLHLVTCLRSEQDFLSGGALHELLGLDYGGFIVPKLLFTNGASSDGRYLPYEFHSERGGRLSITFLAKSKVGHVGVEFLTIDERYEPKIAPLRTFIYHAYSDNQTHTFLVDLFLGRRDVVRPRIWFDALGDVECIVVEPVGAGHSEPRVIGYQYVNALRLLGIKYVVVRHDVHGSVVMGIVEPNSGFVARFLEAHGLLKVQTFGPIDIFEVRGPIHDVYISQKTLTSPAFDRGVLEILSLRIDFSETVISDSSFDLSHDVKGNFRITKATPDMYVVHVDQSMSPFIVILGQNYDPFWEGYVVRNGSKREILHRHFLVNWFANGWYVNETGRFDVELCYSPTKLYSFGRSVSLMTLMISFLMAILPTNRIDIRLTHNVSGLSNKRKSGITIRKARPI
nr:hypothetical protein [Candidatus Njordarchaeum guaymaensis]